jgi:ornithine--oxo-acid transaminase
MISALANNYNPLPVVITKGRDIFLWDICGKKYVDLIAGYSAVNQGHCHPSIVKKLVEQSTRLTLASRVVQNDKLSEWAIMMTKTFNFSKVLPMNTGAEAVDTSLKLARKYGREVCGMDRPFIVCLRGNFHGRTIAATSLSDYEPYRSGFGPFLTDRITVQMNNAAQLLRVFQEVGSSVSAILYEPIQGEGGIVPMSKGFINALRHVKRQFPHVLLMADEIQCGLGRVGYLTASDMYGLKPDVLLLGKALSGGLLPMSCVLANDKAMDVFTPGIHGSTFGGNPLASTVSMEAIRIIQDECIPNVKKVSSFVESLLHNLPHPVQHIRGAGLFWGIQLEPNYSIEELRLRLLQNGYVTCTSRYNTLRLSPPLTISLPELQKAIKTLTNCL